VTSGIKLQTGRKALITMEKRKELNDWAIALDAAVIGN